MAGEITVQQLFQTPTITKVIQQIASPLSLFQQFYGMTPGATASQSVSGRYVGWDIVNPTRSIAKGRAPMTGPATVSRKPIGNVMAQVYRMHEKTLILQEEVFRVRPPGSAIGTVDLRGQSYVRRQIDFLTQKFRNSREFMVSRMFRGGWGVKLEGEDWVPVEYGDSTAVFNVDMQLPSTHKDYLAMGTGANIITESWDDPAADIIGQLLTLDMASERESGRPLRHIWITGSTFKYLLNNTGLQTGAGTAYRVFESLRARESNMQVNGDKFPDSGFDVVFRALPLHTFHVYNGGLILDQTSGVTESSETTPNQRSASYYNLLVPSNKAIFTPEPGSWCGWVEGSEVVAENLMDPGKEVFGFHPWTTRVIDPPGWELKVLDNGLPVLYEPYAVAYGTVIF
jgi:hypothetical protein